MVENDSLIKRLQKKGKVEDQKMAFLEVTAIATTAFMWQELSPHWSKWLLLKNGLSKVPPF